MVELIFLLGLGGSICAASLFFPQVYKAWKMKETRDLAWLTIILGLANGLFWVSYGLLKSDPFIYVTNTLLFIALLLLAILKKKYG